MEHGLAQQAAQQATPLPQQPAQAAQLPTIEEVAQLLTQGITPQELVDAGVPVELIEQAVAMLDQMAAQGQPQGTPQAQPQTQAAPQGQGGLAQQVAQGMM